MAGRMSPRVGTAVSYIGTALLKVIEATDLDRRLRD
jgi:hypothetical protein